MVVGFSVGHQIGLLSVVLRIVVVIDCEFCLVGQCWLCGSIINVLIVVEEILLVGPVRSSQTASEADADIEQGPKSAVGHEDNPEEGVSDALGLGV